MYKVLIGFFDGENGKAWPLDKGGYRYSAGDPYPKEGFTPPDGHIEYLLGSENKFKGPVIERVPGRPKKPAPATDETKG